CDPKALNVGHIGSIYSSREFGLFCAALKSYAARKNLDLRLTLISGRGRLSEPVYREFEGIIEDVPHMAEGDAIKRLAACDFVYAMYPFEDNSRVFRRTSSPTKLTSYLQAQRPIFAHTPCDSSMYSIVEQFGLGVNCPSLDSGILSEHIEHIHGMDIG